ncbi:cytochrome c oxidase assembly factor 4 homolog, mitochondrial [Halyomorpha halys]|uniref:cytochrome c oxidase assembly factor 4 homolog, mitochondrial n=1 Tax=Halyomorpha halys TaxID=286706 RepID=UPI0006D4F946|nr:cytochrome c oxidase assembly factor 4 homolog, mitochondrial-like isoform X3 [Halyomorpha halys]
MSEKEDIDLVDNMIKKTGCGELLYQVQLCVAETRDWRQCQSKVKDFQACIEEHRKQKQKD